MKNFFKDVKETLSDLTEQSKSLKTNLERVKVETENAKKVGESIQRSVNEFQAAAQPKIDKINEIAAKYTPETEKKEA